MFILFAFPYGAERSRNCDTSSKTKFKDNGTQLKKDSF